MVSVAAPGKEEVADGWIGEEKMFCCTFLHCSDFFCTVERPQLGRRVLRGNLIQEMHRAEVGGQHLGSSALPFL